MIDLRVEQVDTKHVRIRGMTAMMAMMLRELPEITELRDRPEAAGRLYPKPTKSDEKINQDWEQMVTPELRHLFVAATETVTRDLTALEPETSGVESYEVTFSVEHLGAWMSALNQARLILSEMHHIDEGDMERRDFDPQRAKDLAVLRIHLLGYLLHLFVELESPNEPKDPV